MTLLANRAPPTPESSQYFSERHLSSCPVFSGTWAQTGPAGRNSFHLPFRVSLHMTCGSAPALLSVLSVLLSVLGACSFPADSTSNSILIIPLSMPSLIYGQPALPRFSGCEQSAKSTGQSVSYGVGGGMATIETTVRRAGG